MKAEEIGPALAEWLAPYIATELKRLEARNYNDAGCAEYVRGLGMPVLNKSATFFGILEQDGRVGSRELANAIGTSGPKLISSNLTNSLKKRATTLKMPFPWDDAVDDENRTVWLDRDGIAGRMVQAVRAEQHRRSVSGDSE